jgi:hypothetical protein
MAISFSLPPWVSGFESLNMSSPTGLLSPQTWRELMSIRVILVILGVFLVEAAWLGFLAYLLLWL